MVWCASDQPTAGLAEKMPTSSVQKVQSALHPHERDLLGVTPHRRFAGTHNDAGCLTRPGARIGVRIA
jgi:hypothetical protein